MGDVTYICIVCDQELEPDDQVVKVRPQVEVTSQELGIEYVPAGGFEFVHDYHWTGDDTMYKEYGRGAFQSFRRVT